MATSDRQMERSPMPPAVADMAPSLTLGFVALITLSFSTDYTSWLVGVVLFVISACLGVAASHVLDRFRLRRGEPEKGTG